MYHKNKARQPNEGGQKIRSYPGFLSYPVLQQINCQYGQIETSKLPLSLEGNLLQNWKTWKQSFTLFMTARENNGKSDKSKVCCYTALADSWGKGQGSLQYLCFFIYRGLCERQ